MKRIGESAARNGEARFGFAAAAPSAAAGGAAGGGRALSAGYP